MAVTIKDIAREVGVSTAAVSLALNDSPMVGAETAKRIKETAQKMGYIRNQYARGLARGRTGVIALVVPDIENMYFAALVNNVTSAAHEFGYDVTIAISNESHELEWRIMRRMVQQRVEAILLVPVNREPSVREYTDWLSVCPVPMVFLSARYPGVNAPCVMCDLENGMRELTESIIMKGARHIALLTGPAGVETFDMRLRGFDAAVLRYEVTPDIWRVDAVTYINAFKLLENMEKALLPDALICVNDMMAVGALNALNAMGVRVPEDMRVAGFDGGLFSKVSVVPLTTVRQDVPLMSRRAVSTALAFVAGKRPSQSELIPCQLVKRRSTD